MARSKGINYFDVLIVAVTYSNQAAHALSDLMTNYVDVASKAHTIHDLEHAADNECHRLCDELNLAFVTPIDREDIYDMIKSIDDITDLIEDVANRFDMFDIKAVRTEAIRMGELVVQATTELRQAMVEFKNYKKTKNIHEMIKLVNSIEEEGDTLYREIVRDLFTKPNDVIEIIKWKDIYDDMENVLDACEDVANIIEGVIMKNN